MTRRRHSHHAFTTIELLVSISILVILAGLVFVGFKAVGNGGKMRATRNTLETAKSLLTEIEIAKGMTYIKAVYKSPPNGTKYQNMFPPVDPAQTPAYPNPLDASTLDSMSIDAYSTSHTIRFSSEAVVRTQMVMARLLSVGANRATLAQLPANSFLTWPFPGAPPTGLVGVEIQSSQTQVGPPARYAFSPPVLVDAWNNPIIYVPPAGLSGVKFKDDDAGTTRIITSVTARKTPYGSAPNNKFEPGATGFWASAGPDGNFTTGDDNIYSFEGF